jgi:hypothetical protein
MDEMGPSVLSWDLEACQMSNVAPSDEEVAARVSAAVAGGFKPVLVNSLLVRPEEGYPNLVSFFATIYSILVVGRVALFSRSFPFPRDSRLL